MTPSRPAVPAGSCTRALTALGLTVLLALPPGALPARAESLEEAFAAAYVNHPQLNAERARLRATDEELARAQSGYRPRITGSAEYTVQDTRTDPPSPGDGTVTPRQYALQVTQPIYSGGQTLSAVREADANIRAARESLRNIEQQVLLLAVTSYLDVVRDRQVLAVREQNLQVLSKQLEQTRARFEVGEVTRTDVEQARASRAAALAQVAVAKANLRISAARYVQATGHAPSELIEPGLPEGLLPATLDEAIAIAVAERPAVVSAAYLEQASQSTIRRIGGELLPQVQLDASIVDSLDPSPLVDRRRVATLTGRVTVPIYEAGETRARLRQAKEQRQGRLEDIQAARETAEADVVSTWSQLQSLRAQIEANRLQVDAAQIALDGVRAEEQVGQRTVLDILNAEQTLLNARLTLIIARHDLVASGYTLLGNMGRLTVSDLGVGVEPYDVEAHYVDTNRKWLDVHVDREEGYAGYELPPNDWVDGQ